MEEPQFSSAWGEDRSLKTAESLRALRDQAGRTLDEHRQRVSEIETRLNEQLQLVADELNRERLADVQSLAASDELNDTLEQLQLTLAEKEAEVEEVLEQLTAQTLEFEAHLAERDEELEQVLELSEEESQQREALQQELEAAHQFSESLEQELDSTRRAVENLQQELDESRQALERLQTRASEGLSQQQSELAEVSEQTDQLNAQLGSLQKAHEGLQTELREVRQASQNKLDELRQASQVELEEAHQVSESAQEQYEQSTTRLKEAEQRIAELSDIKHESEQRSEEFEQTRRKFELALADVHKLKRANAELQEELLSRPEADDQESPELVSLRAERDALAQRVSEFENAPAPEAATDGRQELEDLQRRFELAVDDVRQLKQENAELQQKLAAAPPAAAAAASDGPEDWQAQRARLMATLDAEDQGVADESRQKERATIEGTLSITDRVVAEKDALVARHEAEIAELQSQLESRPAGQDLEELREKIAAEVFGDDEAIQAELSKLQQRREELDGMLRQAELEISVQRATLAREQSALEEKLAELPDEDSHEDESASGKPRRRWLSAMGIKDDED